MNFICLLSRSMFTCTHHSIFTIRAVKSHRIFGAYIGSSKDWPRMYPPPSPYMSKGRSVIGNIQINVCKKPQLAMYIYTVWAIVAGNFVRFRNRCTWMQSPMFCVDFAIQNSINLPCGDMMYGIPSRRGIAIYICYWLWGRASFFWQNIVVIWCSVACVDFPLDLSWSCTGAVKATILRQCLVTVICQMRLCV